MLRFFALIAFLLASAPAASAQETAPAAPPKTYVVSASQLTPGQIAELEAGETLSTVETVGKYAGVGKEIGEGVSGALGALNEEAQKFGDTQVGHFTMAMIAWKIMGDDIVAVSHDMVGYVVGIPFFFLASLALLWSYRRRCLPHTVLVKRGAGIFAEREYQTMEPSDAGGWNSAEWAIAHGVTFMIVTVVGVWMIFA